MTKTMMVGVVALRCWGATTPTNIVRAFWLNFNMIIPSLFVLNAKFICLLRLEKVQRFKINQALSTLYAMSAHGISHKKVIKNYAYFKGSCFPIDKTTLTKSLLVGFV